MIIIDSPSTDAYFNIASEEYLLGKFPHEQLCLFYVNASAIIVGKFQNTLAEINLDYTRTQGIQVVRRLSGGGAVYHDRGNLNFSFHTRQEGLDFMDFSTFTDPLVHLLQRLQVPAQLEGRNDLLVDGKKFSGNAKTVKQGKMIQHGTILIHSDMHVLGDALKVNPLKFVDKAVKSNRSRVTNLIDYLPAGSNTDSFKHLFIQELKRIHPDATLYRLNEHDIAAIGVLAQEKYSSWDWNFGASPKYNFTKAIKVPAGFMELHLDVQHGVILGAKIYGDFFAEQPIGAFEESLRGLRHNQDDIRQHLQSIKLTDYFGKVTTEEISTLFD